MIYHGVGIIFGASGSVSTLNGKMQTFDHKLSAESEWIIDELGNKVGKTYYGENETATFTAIATGTSGSATVTKPTVGTKITVGQIADGAGDTYTAISGSNWLVDNVTVNGSNTSYVRITVELSRSPYIT